MDINSVNRRRFVYTCRFNGLLAASGRRRRLSRNLTRMALTSGRRRGDLQDPQPRLMALVAVNRSIS